MSEKIEHIKFEFIEERKKEKTTEKGKNEGKKAELNEETKREIDQHLENVWGELHWDYVRRLRENKSFSEIEKTEEGQKHNKELMQKAKKQLDAGEAGEEILHFILDFATPEGKEANDKSYMIKILLKRQNLDPDKLPSDDTRKKQIDSYKEQIEADRQKRERWAKKLVENWEKRNRDLIMS